jgi:hypothetical protein
MARRFRSCRAKLARANEHLGLLDTEARLWAEAQGDGIRSKVKRRGSIYTVAFGPIKQPPIRLSIICGDVVHNLRSTLDHIVSEVVRESGHEPSRFNAFPLYLKPEDWESQVAMRKDPRRSPLHRVDPNGEPWAIIQDAQPYKRQYPYSDLLAMLGSLSNRDKHSAIVIQTGMVRPEMFENAVTWSKDAVLIQKEAITRPLSFTHQAVVMALEFAPDSPDPQVRVQGPIPLDPAFGDESRVANMYGLRMIQRRVRQVLLQVEQAV